MGLIEASIVVASYLVPLQLPGGEIRPLHIPENFPYHVLGCKADRLANIYCVARDGDDVVILEMKSGEEEVI